MRVQREPSDHKGTMTCLSVCHRLDRFLRDRNVSTLPRDWVTDQTKPTAFYTFMFPRRDAPFFLRFPDVLQVFFVSEEVAIKRPVKTFHLHWLHSLSPRPRLFVWFGWVFDDSKSFMEHEVFYWHGKD